MPQTINYRTPQPRQRPAVAFNSGLLVPAATLLAIGGANYLMIYGLGVGGFWLLFAAPIANAFFAGACLAVSSILDSWIDSVGLQYIVSLAGPAIAVFVDWKIAWGQFPVC